MQDVNTAEFKKYGRVLALDTIEFCEIMNKRQAIEKGVVYEPSDDEFEEIALYTEIKNEVFGGMPIEFGYCNGYNNRLNAVEYHRSSEINLAATDMILMLGLQYDIDYATNSYHTEKIESFFVPAGTAVELYGTTLHFAPCRYDNLEFRCGVILPKGTNLPLINKPLELNGENKLLFAVNKWLIAHEESGLEKDGAFLGLRGKNLCC